MASNVKRISSDYIRLFDCLASNSWCLALLLAALFYLVTAACQAQNIQFGRSPLGDKALVRDRSPLGDEALIQAQNQHAIKQEVIAQALVKKLLPEDTQGRKHQKFLLLLSNGTTVLVAHNLAIAKAVPIQAGDYIRIKGEYIWNAKGGLIHWTHRSNSPNHPDGWIDFNGRRYD